ncbi:MAG: cell envelope biogenesis protein TonB [Chlorobiota bacterium]|nr:MAG: energy transducer TonB [Chlorobiota bacterium]
MAKVDLTDIVFALKNKEYGAYVLRKLYGKFLSISLIITALFFSTAISMPMILKAIQSGEVNQKQTVTMDVKAQLQAMKKQKEKEKRETVFKEQEKKAPERASVKFTPPVIKPDDQVKEEVQTVEELQNKNVGTVTRQGVEGGDVRGDADVEFTDGLDDKKPEVTKEDVNKQAKEEVFTFAEEMPSFPGGDGALYGFLAQNIQYPEIAKRAGVEGQVIVTFTVSKTGQISAPRVARGIGGGCDEEALRVVMMMPRWNPGKQNGQPVNVQVTVPIRFQLQ